MERPLLLLIVLGGFLGIWGDGFFKKLQQNFTFYALINSKNHIVSYEEIAISQSMKRQKQNYKRYCIISLLDKNTQKLSSIKSNNFDFLSSQKVLNDLVNQKKDEIFDCLRISKISVKNNFNQSIKNTQTRILDNTKLKIYPINFFVDFSDDLSKLIIYF